MATNDKVDPATEDSPNEGEDTPAEVTREDIEATVGKRPADAPTVEEDKASPTGGANQAGTPQSQLNLASPMTDESGSNVLPGSLRQPLAAGVDPSAGASKVTADSLDPALVDPSKFAAERVQGTTSDASTRSADVVQADVPSDPSSGPKRSDAGPEEYPFPPQGDVDVATIDNKAHAGEYYPNLEVDDWVVLDGDHELVPDRLDGRRAIVLDAPRYLVPLEKKDDIWITVRTRDDVNATLHIPLAAVKEVQKGGLAMGVRG